MKEPEIQTALMCLLCADPDKCNVHTGMCALHYATQNNHVSTVSCLIKRGADFNKEDYNGCRPDDFLNYSVDIDDCREGMLSVQNLRVTDLSTVDSDGYTLLMTAASHNRYEI
ncbi:hypothetical protein KUTeg_001978 [Tegillarca granosa]|uniref:Uncharacterized protein n=1 Tax=Tegillarca granosa TaxID=220873 RepID=A0ABQ9FT09_TEGGR|nr:hypothetical protein KUTeg_001978 [Tegillarca granosa]